MQMFRRDSSPPFPPFHVDPPDDVALRPVEQIDTTTVRCPLPAQLVLANRQQFKHQVVDALESGATLVRLDFFHCAYVDSTGLGVLVSISKEAQRRGARLVLEHLNDEMRGVFACTHLDRLFQIER